MTFVFYLCVEAIAIGLFHLGINRRKTRYEGQKVNYFVVLSFFVLLSVIVFRNLNVGTDYRVYINAINRVQYNQMYSFDRDWLSYGIIGLTRIMSYIGITPKILPYIVIGVISFITLAVFYKAFMELSSHPTLSLYIFLCFCLYFQMMNQFKQMAAIAITFLAYKYIDKSFIKYALTILVAGLFHTSALIMLPMYFIVKIEINKKIITLYIVGAIIISYMYPRLINLVRYTKYYMYINSEKYDIHFSETAIYNLIVRLILLIISLAVYRRIGHRNKILYHMIIVCTIFQCITVISYAFGRVTTYFYVYYILLLPEVFDSFKIRIAQNMNSKKIYYMWLYLILFIYQCVYYHVQSKSGGYGEYSFFFSAIESFLKV